MKKIIMFLCLFAIIPLDASVKCLKNSWDLKGDFDDKEWHSVACDCPCTLVRKGYCVECGHLQNAATYTVVLPTKIVHQSKIRVPASPQEVLRKLARRYLEMKMEKE